MSNHLETQHVITRQTALEIARTYQEIENAESLIAKIEEDSRGYKAPDIRDALGRTQPGLQLGVPSGENSYRCYNVPWAMAKIVLQAHANDQRSRLAGLMVVARQELDSPT